MTVSRDDAIELLDAMCRIDSVTPWLIPGGAGEGEVARYMRDWLADLGLEVTLEDVEPAGRMCLRGFGVPNRGRRCV
jgi:succinyl-diaminopimelate desuccinylase